MPRPHQTKYIVIHCTAGYGGVEAIKRFWKQRLGWRAPGYHRIVDLNGKIHKLADFSKFTNGVRGHNHESIHIAYIGGVDRNNVNLAKDTRTPQQIRALIDCIDEALCWLENQNITTELGISVVGHRDFSPDRNGNGVVDSWERIKECPSFDAMKEYLTFTSVDKRNVLPG